MKVSFLAQPLLDPFGGWTATWLTDLLDDPDMARLEMAVAWIKRSGLSRLQDDLVAFRQRGGSSSVIVGIDEGGATAQGLALAMELFDSVRVYHERGRGTFHPKVYLGSGSSTARLLVGSSNVTAGGLFNNHEAALHCHLALEEDADRLLLDQVREWFDTLLSDSEVCLPLTSELLDTLVSDPQYKVRDEDQITRRGPQGEEDYDGVVTDSDSQQVFGTSSIPRKGLAPAVHVSRPAAARRPTVEAPTPPAPGEEAEAAAASVTPRWWKRMTASDAQQPRTTNTNPTGNLKLTKAGHAIDWQTYFRRQMFGDAVWTVEQTERGPLEKALIDFEAIVEGTSRGRHPLKVDHAEYRIADQNNVPTWLHWGPVLGTTLRETDYVDAWVVIERLDDGTHRLEITWAEPQSVE